jgi:4-amino-4-deoxy-L-arabinose transferase-like glycosyltransferase
MTDTTSAPAGHEAAHQAAIPEVVWPTPGDSRRFWRVLLVIVGIALAFRVGYVLLVDDSLVKDGHLTGGDQLYYNAQANTLARGDGFTDFRDGSQTAEHPPLTALVLTPASWAADQIDPDGTHLLAQRLTMAGFGALLVLVIGMIGRRVGGNRVGWVAAAIATLYAGLFVNDALVMSETLATLAVALAILLAYRFGRGPTWGNAACLGAACGLAMLARAELGLLLPCMVLPVALFVRAFTVWRRVLLVLVACAAAGLVVSPWLVANLTRFDEPVLFSTNDGLTICGANLHRTYYGSGTGLWALDCAGFSVPKGDRSVVSNALRTDGLHFVRTHLGRLPVVVAARIGRVWSLYAPGQMADYNQNEGRPVWASWLGFASFWLLVPFAVAGGVLLRRRRVPITPLVAQFAIVTLTAAAIYGLVRFRVPAEVSLVVLAAVALDAVMPRAASPASDAARGGLSGPTPEPGGVSTSV